MLRHGRMMSGRDGGERSDGSGLRVKLKTGLSRRLRRLRRGSRRR